MGALLRRNPWRAPAFAVLDVNDYFSVEGDKRVPTEWPAGNMPHVQLVLLVVELRLEHLAGHTDT